MSGCTPMTAPCVPSPYLPTYLPRLYFAQLGLPRLHLHCHVPWLSAPMFPGDHPYHGSTITAPLT